MSSSPSAVDLARTIAGPLAVIGDLHGAAELLEQLLGRLGEEADFTERWVVFVGDFLDRGEEAARGLDLVLDLLDRHGRVTACMGNHDLAAIGALALVATPARSNWDLRYIADYDAWATFASYGVAISRGEYDALAANVRSIRPYYDPYDRLYAEGKVPARLRRLRDDTRAEVSSRLGQLRQRMPPRHQEFLTALPWCVEHPQYLVVHAGLTGKPFEQQLKVLRTRDFNDGRPPWLHERSLAETPVPGDCPLTVVSGHVTVPEVTFRDRHILVDTCGGYGDTLSAVLLPEGRVVTACR